MYRVVYSCIRIFCRETRSCRNDLVLPKKNHFEWSITYLLFLLFFFPIFVLFYFVLPPKRCSLWPTNQAMSKPLHSATQTVFGVPKIRNFIEYSYIGIFLLFVSSSLFVYAVCTTVQSTCNIWPKSSQYVWPHARPSIAAVSLASNAASLTLSELQMNCNECMSARVNKTKCTLYEYFQFSLQQLLLLLIRPVHSVQNEKRKTLK